MNDSIYIPLLFANHSAEYISEIFHKHEIGVVNRVDMLELRVGVGLKTKNEKTYSAFVHFEHWYSSANAEFLRSRFNSNSVEKIKLSLCEYENTSRYWVIKKMRTRKCCVSWLRERSCVKVYEMPSREELKATVSVMSVELAIYKEKLEYLMSKITADSLTNPSNSYNCYEPVASSVYEYESDVKIPQYEDEEDEDEDEDEEKSQLNYDIGDYRANNVHEDEDEYYYEDDDNDHYNQWKYDNEMDNSDLTKEMREDEYPSQCYSRFVWEK
jgi:hypothetical protein